MSNWLNVRRVRVQDVDEHGTPLGEPEYGIVASDAYEQGFNIGFATLEELNEAVREAGSLLDLVGGFDGADGDVIGFENYAGRFPEIAEAEDSAADAS